MKFPIKLSAFLAVIFFALGVWAQSWTAEKPLKATLIRLDESCAEFKTADGKTFKVKKESLSGLKLVPKTTEIRFYTESLPPHLCGN